MANLDGTNDFFDSREVIERIEELETFATDEFGEVNTEILNDYEAQEYAALIEFRDAADRVSDWHYGETFIRDGRPFVDYVRELLIDCGYVSADFPSWIEVNWESTADNVRTDYTSFELRGVTYWARA